MPLPTTLYNYFNQGRESLEMSSALMNPYAKWMQSPNIPRNTCLPIALETVENVIECEPTVDEWFKNLESNKQKTHSSTPNFFPSEYKTDKFFSITHKGEQRWIHAILSANDPLYSVYSDNTKEKTVTELINKASNRFPKIYDASVFRLYGSKKAVIYSSLFKNTLPSGLHIYSSIINKNILVMREIGYEWCSKICNERDTICLWEHSGEVGSILNSEQKGTINIQSILSNKMDIYEDRTKRIELAYNKDALKKIRELTKMNISDLRNNAGDNGLSIESDGKFLNKQDLIDNMLEKYIESGFN